MSSGVNQKSVLGIKYFYWAVVKNNIPNGTSTTILANGSSAGMGRLEGVQSLSVAEPDAPESVVLGNNGVVAKFIGEPQDLPTGAMNLGTLDDVFSVVSNGVKIATEGIWEFVPGFPKCFNYADLMFLICAPAKSTQTGSVGESGWDNQIILRVSNQSKTLNERSSNTSEVFGNKLVTNRADTTPWGEAFDIDTYGTTEMVSMRFWAENPCTMHTLIGNALVTTLVLNETPIAANGDRVKVWVNGVLLDYTDDYSVNLATKTITFVSAPALAAKVVVLYEHSANC